MTIVLRPIFFILLIFCIQSCTEIQKRASKPSKTETEIVINKDSNFLLEKLDWQNDFGLTHNIEIDTIWKKPVKYYFDNPKCSPIAKEFYIGKFRPTDNDSTSELLSLVTTRNNELRPFYRWCLNKTIQVQDGALAEYTGVPARQYIEKYPSEFFEYIDEDKTDKRYNDWTSSISYNGFYDEDDHRKTKEIKYRMTKNIKKNFKSLDLNFEKRISKLVDDCF